MTEALDNLISNALKYSNKEKYLGISVKAGDGWAQVGVQDRGIGIPRDEQQKIFDAYYRAGDKNVQTIGGAGLGLSLVRHIMEAHGGRIDVTSAPGAGSIFTMYFPLGDDA